MRPNVYLDSLENEIQAVFDGLVSGPLDAEPTPELIEEVFARLGDALRAGVHVPRPLRAWLEKRAEAEIETGIQAARQEVDAWVLPETHEDEGLSFLLVRRDNIESFRCGLIRWCMEHAVKPDAVAGFAELEGEVLSFDRRLAKVVSRAQAEPLLGNRVHLLGAHGWTSALAEGLPDVTSAADLAWDDAMLDFPPSDEVISQYIESGAFAKYVERFARDTPEFADELRELIRTAREHVAVAFRARVWEKASGDPVRIPIDGPRRLAAATTDETSPARTSVLLGQLIAGASGRVRLSSTALALIVYAPHGALREVKLNNTFAQPVPEGANTKWAVSIERSAAPFLIRIVASDGDVFEHTVLVTEVNDA